MAKLTREQQKQLDELNALANAPEDNDDEVVVWVRKGEHETRLVGDRAKRWLRTHGYDEDDAEDSSKAEPLEEESHATAVAKPEPTKRAVAKKTVPAAAATEADETDDSEVPVEQDAPARTSRRVFF